MTRLGPVRTMFDTVWATLYATGWTVFSARRGIVAEGLSRKAAERMLPR